MATFCLPGHQPQSPEDGRGEETQLAQKIKRAMKTHSLWASSAIWWLLSSPLADTLLNFVDLPVNWFSEISGLQASCMDMAELVIDQRFGHFMQSFMNKSTHT